MKRDSPNQYSDRAHEVARDLFEELDRDLEQRNAAHLAQRFHLDGSEVVLSRQDAESWAKQSVDEGFPEIRYYIERSGDVEVVVNLAAFEDPDSQYHA